MRKLTLVLVLVIALLWATAALADYSALDDNNSSVSVGLGGLALTTSATAGTGSQFLPTISLTGMSDYVVWQAFYGTGGGGTALGGSVDYNWGNRNDCAVCHSDSRTWYGAGLSVINYSNLFADSTGANSLSSTSIGANVGLGGRWNRWGADLYVHYFPSNQVIGIQGQILYNLGH